MRIESRLTTTIVGTSLRIICSGIPFIVSELALELLGLSTNQAVRQHDIHHSGVNFDIVVIGLCSRKRHLDGSQQMGGSLAATATN
jgi:hypothetical protein